MNDYSWQLDENGKYSYEPTAPEKKKPNQLLLAILISFLVSSLVLTIFALFILPSIRPAAIISYQQSGNKTEENETILPSNLSGFVGFAEELGESVVAVETQSTVGGFFSMMIATNDVTGIVVSKDGYIITPASSIQDISNIKVRLSDNNVLEAKLVGRDERTDIALLKVDKTDMKPIEFQSSEKMLSGTQVASLGRYLTDQLGTTLSVGTICHEAKQVTLNDGQTVEIIQTDACSKSCAGSVLLNSNKKAVAMIISSLSANSDNVAIGVTSQEIVSVLEGLMNYQKTSSSLNIGITATAAKYGVTVESVQKDSPADKAGIKVGDLITKVDAKVVKSIQEINEIKQSHKQGEKMIFNIYRDGEIIEVNVILK